jgi:FKBP-type peptidyl-prolyl cis-trans isomerase
MNNLKPLTLTIGVAALIAITYFGFGIANQQNAPVADTGAAVSKSDALVTLDTDEAKLGYLFGAQIGMDIVNNDMVKNIDVDAFISAQREILSGGESRMTPEEMQQAQLKFQQKQKQAFEKKAADNLAKGEAFLEKSKVEESVKSTESGLLYQELQAGTGKQPVAEDTVEVHYKGMLSDGTVFDSSYERNQPVEFPVTGVIPGFSEGLQLMKEGAKYKLIIPSDIAYGPQGSGPVIGPNEVLIFEVELLSIK